MAEEEHTGSELTLFDDERWWNVLLPPNATVRVNVCGVERDVFIPAGMRRIVGPCRGHEYQLLSWKGAPAPSRRERLAVRLHALVDRMTR